MDSKLRSLCLIFLIISSILCSQSRADATGSVYFLDRSPNYYFQSPSFESKSMLLPEVGAAISVLLGFAPPSTLSSASSEKLNEVLIANPFNRPRVVFLLEINGFGDKQLEVCSSIDVFSRALKSEVTIEDAEIQVFGKGESILMSLDETLHDMEFTDKVVTDFASWMDGSYVSSASEVPLTGELTFFLSNDVQLKLHMSKKADREFTRSLVSLIDHVQTALQLHEDLVGSKLSPAELIKGRFDGFKAFQEHYGTNDIVQKAAELLVTSISKIYDSLQTAHKDQIVGVIVFNESPTKESDTLLNVKFTSRLSPRYLEEEGSAEAAAAAASRIAEVFLVRRVLAWITGIILIISTLMGIWFLMYMPITRDTLLYSNVKLD